MKNTRERQEKEAKMKRYLQSNVSVIFERLMVEILRD
jgi:hypothetical protein